MTVTALGRWRGPIESDLERARRGDQQAFTDIVNQHEAMVFSIALHAIGKREIAEEIAQEVFLQLYRSLDRIGSDEHLTNWLRRTATHRTLDYCRTRSKASFTAIDSVPEPSVEHFEPDPLLGDLLRKHLRALPSAHRMIVVLRFGEQMKLKEIAASLDMPLNTVKTNLRRALTRLRELIGNEER